jgi:type IV secretory pathway VirB2 component (pilin)
LSYAVFIVLIFVGLRISGHVDASQLIDIVKTISIAFMSANIVGKFTPPSKSAPNGD